jgi:hypothetical protein
MEVRDLSRKGEMMPARRRDRAEIAALNDGGTGRKKYQAGQGIRHLRWIAGKIGKLFEKRGQLRRAETCVFAKTGRTVHAGVRFEFGRRTNQLRFVKVKS